MIFERLDPSQESEWYDKKTKTIYQLDFIYFYIGEHHLASNVNFDQEYMKFLKDTFNIEKNVSNKKIQGCRNIWYFDDITPDQYLSLSDKYQLAKLHSQWGHYDHEVYLLPHQLHSNDLKSDQYYIKQPWGFSGRGNSIVNKNQLLHFASTQNQPTVVEQYLNRKLDFAITYFDEDNFIIYQNTVSASGQYLSTKINKRNCYSIDKFLESHNLSSTYITQFKKRFTRLVDSYRELVGTAKFRGSFDFFLYSNGQELQAHPGCEFNPRMTMGRVAWIIMQKYFTQSHIFVSEFAKAKREGMITLSPKDSKIIFQVQSFD